MGHCGNNLGFSIEVSVFALLKELSQQLERAHPDRVESHLNKIFSNTSPKNRQVES
ncbi:hypothetical protein DPMN_049713 [Dreissena polymorpha]|uniref:tRNA nucleotidyltransferase/poly(A) polymerase RNA and SrmB- binding domain-containing protein n=1 Tax=Dreissena polymorpha TaxID=45954 RepID=A0A9D4CEU2_DREPO|nr:hypothetical protein DPMN_049713 [Dreissena polymorpha]